MSKLFDQLLTKFINTARSNQLIMRDSVNIYLPQRDVRMLTYGMTRLLRADKVVEAKMIARLIWNDLTFEQFMNMMSDGIDFEVQPSEFEEYLNSREGQRDPPSDEEIPF